VSGCAKAIVNGTLRVDRVPHSACVVQSDVFTQTVVPRAGGVELQNDVYD